MPYSNMPNNMRSQMSGTCGCRNVMPDRRNSYMSKSDMDCDCDRGEGYMDKFPVAMAYVPWQDFGEVYPLDRGFHAGTIFPVLDLPFLYANPACNRKGGRV